MQQALKDQQVASDALMMYGSVLINQVLPHWDLCIYTRTERRKGCPCAGLAGKLTASGSTQYCTVMLPWYSCPQQGFRQRQQSTCWASMVVAVGGGHWHVIACRMVPCLVIAVTLCGH
jgi:hypothetical protein